MKKTQLIEVFANIRATIVSFISIAMFVALGIAVLLGLQWASKALAASMDKAFAQTNYHDILVQAPVGFQEDEIEELRKIDGVESIETGYQSTQQVNVGSIRTSVRFQTVPPTMDQLIVHEGTLPQKANEIALMDHWAKNNGFMVGDTISLVHDGNDADGMNALTGDTYTITALVESPQYTSKDSATYSMVGSTVSGVGFVTEDAFDKNSASFLFGIPCLYVKCANTQGLSTFSDQYKGVAGDVAQRINDKSAALLTERLSTTYDTVKVAMDTLTKVVDNSRKAVKALKAEESKILEQQKQGSISQSDANDRIAKVYAGLDKCCAEFNKESASALDSLGLPPLEGIDRTTVSEILDDLQNAIQDKASFQMRFMGQNVKFNEIPNLINNLNETFVKNGRNAFTLDRAHNGGVVMAQMLMSILDKLRYSMASLFVVVGLLVCYSAISRIVNENMMQIGTKKALGIFVGEVTASYLLYAGIAVCAGVVAGVLVALFVVQTIINPALANVFVLGRYARYFSLMDTMLAGGIELLLILAATWFSCNRILRKRTVELLSGVVPPTAKEHFYESWSVWKRLPLFRQVVINNCFNDKRRVVATLVGVAGCTSLIVCAITLNNNVLGSFAKQYKDVYGFDAIAQIDPTSKTAQKDVAAKLDKGSLPNAPVYYKTCVLSNGKGNMAIASLIVPTNADKFQSVYHINPTNNQNVDLKDDGAWIGSGFAASSGLKVGDKVEITDSTGQSNSVPILGFFEHHLINVDVVMGANAYKTHFGTEPIANSLLVSTANQGYDAVAKSLAGTKGYLNLKNDKALANRAFVQFSKLSRAVVIIYLGLSALMAAIVLLNLDIMYVNEKKRELTVLMICGFTTKEAKSYVRSDTIVLTAIGVVIGVAVGALVGYVSVVSVEPPNVSFIHGVDAVACLVGIAATFVFSLIAGYVALRRIPRFSLTDINRM